MTLPLSVCTFAYLCKLYEIFMHESEKKTAHCGTLHPPLPDVSNLSPNMSGPNLHLISPYGLTLVYVSAFLLFLVASIGRPSHFFYLFSIKTSDAEFKFGPWGYCQCVQFYSHWTNRTIGDFEIYRIMSSYAICDNSLGWTFKHM